MPANSTIFNQFLFLCSLQLALIPVACGQLPDLSYKELQWLGDRVFANECASRFDCLTSWNEGEDFPSLGIGHFIWFQSDQDEIFEESFPALIAFSRQRGIQIPSWLEQMDEVESPWRSREQFYNEFESAKMSSLREFFADSTETQVAFIVHRLEQSLPTLFNDLDPQTARLLESRFYKLAASSRPHGLYALIDYVHFKGTGIKPSERYAGEGWGLIQVLQQMSSGSDPLQDFVLAASTVLERRVSNAPAERNEQRWFQGWNNRLATYLPL